jgi:outer membrane lipoprotein-sorting protein
MRKLMLVVAVALLAASAFGQSKQGNLEQVLNLLDRTSTDFKTVQTDFDWDQYMMVTNDHDRQKGVMYFKRSGANVDVAADFTFPEKKKLLFTGGDLQVYTPRTNDLKHYNAGKNRAEFESFLVLGFGGRGHDLTKNFEVRYAGVEPIDGKPTYKLELTPKQPNVLNMFPLITLWIDQQKGMSVQQKFQEGKTDYRLVKYSNIKVNPKLPEDAFKLKRK